MILFDCTCTWRFIVGRKQVYGPIYTAPESAIEAIGYPVYNQGRMMSRQEFEDLYADCAYQLEKGVGPPPPHAERQRFCYEPHFDRHDHGLPNGKYLPHVHIPSTDGRGRPVKIIWESAGGAPAEGG